MKPAFRNVAIVYREPSARWLLSTVASELAPDPAAWHDIGDVGSSERARAQDIARRAEECDADLVVMTVDDARPAARRILARGGAVLAVPPAWRAGAGLTRIAVGYDGSEPADAAVEATRALVAVRDGSALRVEIVHVDDSASAATEVDDDVVDSRRTAVIEWWLAGVGERIPASVGVMRHTGDPVSALAELSRESTWSSWAPMAAGACDGSWAEASSRNSSTRHSARYSSSRGGPDADLRLPLAA